MKKRKLYQCLSKHLYKKEYTIITGARQTGKTTLLKQMEQELKAKQKQAYYINLEDKSILSNFNEHPENILKYITLDQKAKTFVLIDEIQYLNEPSNFLKLLFDNHSEELKIVATGSSAFYIDKKFTDSLAGRKRIFHLYTLDFDEFIEFKTTDNKVLAELKKIRSSSKYISLKRREISLLFDEYLTFGGYPAVVLEDKNEEKKLILKELTRSYLQKDILDANIRDQEKFYHLLVLLAQQSGSLLNINELSNTLKLSVTAVENYIYILQKSFHIHLIKPFHKNIRKELTKMPKIYFNDLGFRTTLLNTFQDIKTRLDKGEIIENYAFIRLREKHQIENIKYWRTTSGNEVDFIIDDSEKSINDAFEIKFNSTSYNKKKYKKFMESYPNYELQLKAYIANNNTEDIMTL